MLITEALTDPRYGWLYDHDPEFHAIIHVLWHQPAARHLLDLAPNFLEDLAVGAEKRIAEHDAAVDRLMRRGFGTPC